MNKLNLSIFLILIGLLSIAAEFGFEVPNTRELAVQLGFRQGQWITMQSDVRLEFVNNGQKAGCNGSLLYHRLDEKILLHCYNAEGKMLFAFKTDDLIFELYLPSQETLYTGNIFDLENSQDLDSHIKPLALYRSLKVMRFPQARTEVETWNNEKAFLKVLSNHLGGESVSRRLEISHLGDVTKEIYYDYDENPSVIIKRDDFKEYEGSYFQRIFFPNQIIIEEFMPGSDDVTDTTSILFGNISFVTTDISSNWRLNVPGQTKRTIVRDRILPAVAGA